MALPLALVACGPAVLGGAGDEAHSTSTNASTDGPAESSGLSMSGSTVGPSDSTVGPSDSTTALSVTTQGPDGSDSSSTAGPPEPPLPATPILWLRADAGVLTDGDDVMLWEDQSDAGNHASAPAESSPQLVEAALNGLPVIRFSGGQWLWLQEPLALEPWTVFIVAKSNHPGSGFHMLLGSGGSQENTQIRFESPTELLIVGPGNGTPVVTSDIGDATIPHRLTIAYDRALWRVWRDGALASSTPASTTGTMDLSTIGAWFSQHPLIGDVAELIVYPVVLTDDERVTVETYLQVKYALP